MENLKGNNRGGRRAGLTHKSITEKIKIYYSRKADDGEMLRQGRKETRAMKRKEENEQRKIVDDKRWRRKRRECNVKKIEKA